MLNDLKQDLIEKIGATEDENLLLLLKADYEYFAQNNKRDIIDELSEEDKAALMSMIREPFGKDTISQQEFDEAIRQWRAE